MCNLLKYQINCVLTKQLVFVNCASAFWVRDRSGKPTARNALKGRPGEDLERIARPVGTPPIFFIKLIITVDS